MIGHGLREMNVNFSGIANHSLVGKALRAPLRLIPREAKLPILQGRLRGGWWIAGSGTHGCWLGSYEHRKQALFAETVEPGSVVFDVGAHVGYYTLLASSLTGPSGKVYAFEPLPRNLRYLHQHLRLNKVSNAVVLEMAATETSGPVKFAEGPESSLGHVSPFGSLGIRGISLDDAVSLNGLPAVHVIKMDIEGGEAAALRGARRTLEEHRPIVFLATHGAVVHRECCEILTRLQYRLRSIDDRSFTTTDELLALPSSS